MRPALTRRLGALIVVLGLLASLAAAAPVLGASITVNSLDGAAPADDGECTLREAITAANDDAASGASVGECAAGFAADTIIFGVAGTILLASALPAISSNVSIDGAGAITVSGASVHQVFNIAAGTVLLSGLTISGGAGLFGAGIRNVGTLTVTNSTISGNTALFGGGIDNDGTLTVTNSTISGNTATLAAGIFNEGGATLTVTNSTISGNTAPSVGGGIVNDPFATLTITNSTISTNTGLLGGGIFNSGGTLVATNVTISGNTAADDGGGVYGNGTLTFTNSTISTNTAAFDGGGIHSSGGILTVTDSTISGNTAFGDDVEGGGLGGGIFGIGGSVTNSTISGNTAGNDGGGIHNTGTLTVTDSTISENTAQDGDGGGIHNNATLTVTGSTISENNAFSLGGGILSDTGTVTVASSTISGNSATTSGGGIYNQAANLIVSNSTISGNLGILGAGGMYNHIGGILTVTNSTISGNAGDIGGGIGNEGTVAATNVTISENTSSLLAGGIYAQGAETLVNAIVAGNTTLIGPEINGPVETETTSVIGVPVGKTLADILVPAGLADNGGPTETIALALVAGNPAIDTGTSAACAAASVNALDQRGFARPVACDIGAYEAQPPTVAAHANVSASATSAAGAGVTYSPPAGTDEQGGIATVACLPASGSTFPVGSTTVTCTATDAVGHTGTGTFQVIVGAFTPPTTPTPTASPTATAVGLPNTAASGGTPGVAIPAVALALLALLSLAASARPVLARRRADRSG